MGHLPGVSSLGRNFKKAVDEYLRFCKEEGKTPDTPFKGSFNVHKRAALYAEMHQQKLNAVVHDAFEEYLGHAG